MPSTVISTVVHRLSIESDLAGDCACGQFIVSAEGEAYYVRARLKIENSGKMYG